MYIDDVLAGGEFRERSPKFHSKVASIPKFLLVSVKKVKIKTEWRQADHLCIASTSISIP